MCTVWMGVPCFDLRGAGLMLLSLSNKICTLRGLIQTYSLCSSLWRAMKTSPQTKHEMLFSKLTRWIRLYVKPSGLWAEVLIHVSGWIVFPSATMCLLHWVLACGWHLSRCPGWHPWHRGRERNLGLSELLQEKGGWPKNAALREI